MEVTVVRSVEDSREALAQLMNATILGCDTETSGLHPSSGDLLSLQFSDGSYHVLVPVSEGISPLLFAEVFEDLAVTKVFHNARFDLGFLAAADVAVNNIFDTMVAEKVLTKGANQSASLSETLYRYFAIDLDKSKRKRFGRNWNGQWTDDLVEYAMNDVAHLPALMAQQRTWLANLGLEKDYELALLAATG
ncbi:MAG: hypothetical protein DWQ47_13295 [Acidobacteria bacterium]|nr:MAG: hypothetical protein DWQ32_00695 [Acidobacteriota bacterium]REK02946.1 MAG: hypothetical protein DWQ38_11440 [Acidobacteriota bacterium]REK13250.1 MAG: hypothetical protein DWQ43_06385 [Acidobacteriota bacterium]REK41244.1 MAG: hypothetical protein DWQ47_13295 [Acidobacteriota bacterium]